MAISRILVPTDFSPAAGAALRFASELAQTVGASLRVIHVVENPVEGGPWSGQLYTVEVGATTVNSAEAVEEKLQELVSRLPAEFATGSWVRTNSAAAAVVSYAAENGVDLIVMGTSGRKGLGHLVIGSVAEHVVRCATCPVVTVREDAPQDRA
jgi:nucleotide-binding universal stress UspA family protein